MCRLIVNVKFYVPSVYGRIAMEQMETPPPILPSHPTAPTSWIISISTFATVYVYVCVLPTN